MKKISRIVLLVLMFVSCISSFLYPKKVSALASSYTYAYVNTDDL